MEQQLAGRDVKDDRGAGGEARRSAFSWSRYRSGCVHLQFLVILLTLSSKSDLAKRFFMGSRWPRWSHHLAVGQSPHATPQPRAQELRKRPPGTAPTSLPGNFASAQDQTPRPRDM